MKGYRGIGAIAEALKVNKSLTNLDLQFNNIGEQGAAGVRAIAGALMVNTSLTSLNLSYIEIGRTYLRKEDILSLSLSLENVYSEAQPFCPGGIVIAQALKVNASLTALNLRGNQMGAKEGIVFAEALKVNTSLTNLDLQGNNIGAEGGTAIAKALTVNTSLTHLKVNTTVDTSVEGSGVNISAKADRAITKSLMSNIKKKKPWERRKGFLLFLHYEEFLLLKSSGDRYTVHHKDTAKTDVFYNRDLNRFICSYL
jgi:Ran GTPase-activating protein (RanGAP) involved in mRNA processing and transport